MFSMDWESQMTIHRCMACGMDIFNYDRRIEELEKNIWATVEEGGLSQMSLTLRIRLQPLRASGHGFTAWAVARPKKRDGLDVA